MRLCAATADGVWVMRRDDADWQVRHAQLQGRAFWTVAVSPHQKDVIFAGADGHGLFRSVNGGGSWRPMSRGLESPYVHSIAFDATDPRVIFVTTLPAAVYRSSDGGETWEPLPDLALAAAAAPRPPQVVTHPTQTGQVYVLDAGVGGALHCSSDGGRTWLVSLANAGRLHELTALPRLLLLAADDGLQRSTDDGATWELARNTRAACAVSAFPAASSAQCAGLLRTTSGHPALIGSQDGGRTWFPTPIAAPLGLRQIKLAPLTIFGIEGTGALLRAPWQTPADSPAWFVLSDELPPVFGIGWSE